MFKCKPCRHTVISSHLLKQRETGRQKKKEKSERQRWPAAGVLPGTLSPTNTEGHCHSCWQGGSRSREPAAQQTNNPNAQGADARSLPAAFAGSYPAAGPRAGGPGGHAHVPTLLRTMRGSPPALSLDTTLSSWPGRVGRGPGKPAHLIPARGCQPNPGSPASTCLECRAAEPPSPDAPQLL